MKIIINSEIEGVRLKNFKYGNVMAKFAREKWRGARPRRLTGYDNSPNRKGLVQGVESEILRLFRE